MMQLKLLCSLVVFIFISVFYFTRLVKLSNISDYSACPTHHFHLHGMVDCHPWLTCNDLEFIDIKELIGVGGVKAVYRSQWNNLSIAYSILNNKEFLNDFRHGLDMLKLLNPNPYIIQLIGFCENENVILTEYHKHGNAINITTLLQIHGKNDNLQTRLKLCLNYALLLEYLHNGPAGCRVMCDSNSLEKLLSQLLVTDELAVLLNDLDALPETNKKVNQTVKCGHRILEGSFIAPEQHSSSHDNNEVPGYDEKTDIWKAASVCDHFIGNVADSEMARYRLFFLHKSCKSVNPKERPTATQLAAKYMKIMYELKQEEL